MAVAIYNIGNLISLSLAELATCSVFLPKLCVYICINTNCLTFRHFRMFRYLHTLFLCCFHSIRKHLLYHNVVWSLDTPDVERNDNLFIWRLNLDFTAARDLHPIVRVNHLLTVNAEFKMFPILWNVFTGSTVVPINFPLKRQSTQIQMCYCLRLPIRRFIVCIFRIRGQPVVSMFLITVHFGQKRGIVCEVLWT